MSGGSSECTGCEGAWQSAVPVCLRPCGDDALSDAVQAAAAWATATKAAAVAVPAMWTGAAMSRGLGVWQRRLLAALEERPTVSWTLTPRSRTGQENVHRVRVLTCAGRK